MAAKPTPENEQFEGPRQHHVCPWWAGYLITNPIRKIGENPEIILAPFVEPGMTTIDIGCGMGFFSLPLARMVGPTGRVVSVDIQRRMLSSLERRARRRRLDRIIITRKACLDDLGLDDLRDEADLAIAVHVMHETAYPRRTLSQIFEALCPGGTFLMMEPKGHVTDRDFKTTQQQALEIGFSQTGASTLKKSRGLVFSKPLAR